MDCVLHKKIRIKARNFVRESSDHQPNVSKVTTVYHKPNSKNIVRKSIIFPYKSTSAVRVNYTPVHIS